MTQMPVSVRIVVPVLSCLLASLSCSFALAQSSTTTGPSPTAKPASKKVERDPFPAYSDKARGWHYKETIPDPVEPEIEPPPPVKPTPVPPPSEPQGPKPLSPEWIRVNMPKYLDAAIENPTPQNVSNYLYLQKFSMDASDRFSQVYSRVVMTDPLLDENNTRPVWNAASQAMDEQADKAKAATLTSLAKSTGLWFFFRSDCQPCHMQAPILAAVAKRYGFAVLPISVDGSAMPNSPFPNFVVDRGQADKYGVQYTPSIYLAKPPNTVISLTQGLLAISDLERRIIEIATDQGLITDSQYASTRPDKKNLLPSSATANLPTADANDPNLVRQHLRSLIASRKQ